jgi:hypothetical protein
MPIAAPGALGSAGPPSGSSIWNSFTPNRRALAR